MVLAWAQVIVMLLGMYFKEESAGFAIRRDVGSKTERGVHDDAYF